MKRQVLAQKISMFIFTALLFIYGIHATSYARSVEFVEGETTTREIAENTPVGTYVGAPLRYVTNLPDKCIGVSFSGPDIGSFDVTRVSPGSLQLKTKAPLNQKKKNAYEVRVRVLDWGSPATDLITVNITVTEVNEAPAFSEQVDEAAVSAPAMYRNRTDFLLDQAVLKTSDGNRVKSHLQRLHYHSDDFLKYQQAITLLESTLAPMRPEKTVLLPNYPNPFNPETWIPYHLAKATDVQISIYNAHGIVVRHLELGHQSTGYYTSRSRAAYWDGKNDFGEPVASGVYFYQLQADTVSPMRKMVILK